MQRSSAHFGWQVVIMLALGLAMGVPGWAWQVTASTAPTVGSANVATADPPVPRPATQPCTVTLFANQAFADFNPKTFTYTPPAGCPAPWAKVVFEGDFSVTAGVQYDRTAQIALGHVNIYYGTTSEPSSSVAPSWHVERDLTDYSSLFETAHSGDANIGNLVNSTYTGVISGTATLQFYPLARGQDAPRTADMVLPMSTDAGGAATLNDGTSVLAPTFTLPTNIENVYLDLIAQSQHDDEFWYTCVPNNLSSELGSCGGTSFRETEVTVDGKPAGVAPVYPWIFTGGIDPILWRPIPGVQTLDFVPYRVDLTPFAGVLSDGQQHTVGVSVFNADDYFLVAGNLLIYQDAGASHVTGAVTLNTLTADPALAIKPNLKSADNQITGSVTTAATRQYTIAGYVLTSHGRVATSVSQKIVFVNTQRFLINSDVFVQNIAQHTDITASTSQTVRGHTTTTSSLTGTWPLTMNIAVATNSDGSFDQTTFANQSYQVTQSPFDGAASGQVSNTVQSKDTLLISASDVITGYQNAHSSQVYTASDSDGYCYSRKLTSANRVLTSVSSGPACQ